VARCGLGGFHVQLEDLLAEGDEDVHRWIATATHEESDENIAAIGKEVTVLGITRSAYC
jgi:hypothetical protein